jgi:hypothetical protein
MKKGFAMTENRITPPAKVSELTTEELDGVRGGSGRGHVVTGGGDNNNFAKGFGSATK